MQYFMKQYSTLSVYRERKLENSSTLSACYKLSNIRYRRNSHIFEIVGKQWPSNEYTLSLESILDRGRSEFDIISIFKLHLSALHISCGLFSALLFLKFAWISVINKNILNDWLYFSYFFKWKISHSEHLHVIIHEFYEDRDHELCSSLVIQPWKSNFLNVTYDKLHKDSSVWYLHY